MLRFWPHFYFNFRTVKIVCKKRRDEILNNLIDLDGIGETQIEAINTFFFKRKKF